MESAQHVIRFKRDGVEFEMTGDAAEIAKAWEALRPAVVDSFSPSSSPPRKTRDAPAPDRPGDDEQAPRKPRRSRSSTRSSRAVGRPDVMQRLMEAPVDSFPEIGDEPPAQFAGYATLEWTHDTLGLDDLQVGELHAFLSQRLRIPHTANAYRNAFAKYPRTVNGVGRPAAFRLMAPGQKALRTYLAKVASGASPSDAEAEARAEAEE